MRSCVLPSFLLSWYNCLRSEMSHQAARWAVEEMMEWENRRVRSAPLVTELIEHISSAHLTSSEGKIHCLMPMERNFLLKLHWWISSRSPGNFSVREDLLSFTVHSGLQASYLTCTLLLFAALGQWWTRQSQNHWPQHRWSVVGLFENFHTSFLSPQGMNL